MPTPVVDKIPAWGKELREKATARLLKNCSSIRMNSQHIATDGNFVTEFYSGWIKGEYSGIIQIVYWRIESKESSDYPGWYEFYSNVDPTKFN